MALSDANHTYDVSIIWEGNRGRGTTAYAAYDRRFRVTAAGKTDLLGSADPAFRGDRALYNPEDLLVAAAAGCHMLTYLALAAREGVAVVAYGDDATGVLDLDARGGGRFRSITLHPRVVVGGGAERERALRLHQAASERCFIARSCAFPIHHEPTLEVA